MTISSLSVICLFIFIEMPFNEKKFKILMESNLSSFSFKVIAFLILSKNLCLPSGCKDILSCSLLEDL